MDVYQIYFPIFVQFEFSVASNIAFGSDGYFGTKMLYLKLSDSPENYCNKVHAEPKPVAHLSAEMLFFSRNSFAVYSDVQFSYNGAAPVPSAKRLNDSYK